MLMDFAVSHRDTQLILLTPLAIEAINDAAERTRAAQPTGNWPAADFLRIRKMVPVQRRAMQFQPAPQ